MFPITISFSNVSYREEEAAEMAQCGKVLADKPVDLSPIPGSHTTEGEIQLLHAVL